MTLVGEGGLKSEFNKSESQICRNPSHASSVLQIKESVDIFASFHTWLRKKGMRMGEKAENDLGLMF